jgi:hypothetical protein
MVSIVVSIHPVFPPPSPSRPPDKSRELSMESVILPDLSAIRYRSDKREVRGSTPRWPMTRILMPRLRLRPRAGRFVFVKSGHGVDS